ncbi:hypothetical protein SOVF_186210 [Spinacia oleracea]|uniref:Protein ZW2-like n=1 Tax=Spinacia oleracea TaxID=3562 RepID=A0A9R0IZY8_SPIOL|nr:protein ZW2-like [Spinacia oleracea]KNA05864.1 hypothetical protein SOVF_186210 [Spinacia oleracea]
MSSHLETKITASEAFSSFFNGWLCRQQVFLDQLEDKNNNQQLIQLLLNHYSEYYDEKARVIWEDPFLLFSPPWLTSFEKSFLWVAGFKPSLAFRLLELSVFDLELEQLERLTVLKADVAREERTHLESLAAVQETTGAPPLLNLAKHYGRLVDGEVSKFPKAVQGLCLSMSRVVQGADNLRRNTTIKLLDILNVNQSLNFLAYVAKFQLGIRTLGLGIDSKMMSQDIGLGH